MPKRTIPNKQFAPALLIALGLSATWAVPAVLDAAVPPATQPIEHGEINSGYATFTFDAPEGWQVQHQTSDSELTLVNGDASIDFTVVSGVKDFDHSAKRKAAELDRAGISLAYDGEPIDTSKGLKGRSCYVFRAADQHGGPCGFVEKEGDMVLVYALAPEEQKVDIEPVIDSIEIKKEA